MPHEVTLRGPVYTFKCFGKHEAKRLGLIDSWKKEGSHAPVSTIFEQGEGKLLADWIEKVPDAILVETNRYQITVFRPKSGVVAVPNEGVPKEEPSRPKTYTRLHKAKAGRGDSRVEGADGIEGYDSFNDVKNACGKMLDQWESNGALPPYLTKTNDHLFRKKP